MCLILSKKDIRDVVSSPVQKIYVVFSKMYMDEKYSFIEKMDKSFGERKYIFREKYRNCWKDKIRS